jgi:hypothetical protein
VDVRTRLRALAGAWLALLAPHAGAQQQTPPKVDAQTLVHQLLLGRFYMPVTCAHEDGSLFEREEAVVFRTAADNSGFPAVRATFFGVEASEAVRCSNAVHPRLKDRRGSLFLRFEAHHRPDLGVRDVKQALQRGPLEFRVVSGRLELREIGSAGAEPERLDFDGGSARLELEAVRPQTDEGKMLDIAAPPEPGAQTMARRFNVRISGPDGLAFSGSYLEDLRRRR